MKSGYLLLVFICLFHSSKAQRLLDWTPEFPVESGNISFTVDCTKGNRGLFNYEAGNSNNVYVHVGLITSQSTGPTDWKYTKFTWGSADLAARATPLGNNKYQYTITNIRSFFGVPAGESIKKLTVVFRNANGNNSIKQVNSDNSDMYIPVYGNSEFAVRLNLPVTEPRYIPWVEPFTITAGSPVPVTGVSSTNAALTLKLNGTTVASTLASNSISASPAVLNCNNTIVLEGNDGSGIKRDSISFYIPPSTSTAALPAGLTDGINYSTDPTEVTLVLYAPGKNNVVVLGDFSNWAVNCNYQMTRTPDNNRFFIRMTGLTAGMLYRYQYLVDGAIKIADPYTELVLDPSNDGFIPATTFPNLPAYPAASTTGMVGTFRTNEIPFSWTASNYIRPDKKNLVIYELLLRDFLAQSNWQTLADTLGYLQKLGINAIELMPFNEFEGNSSWGYNPNFFFAPDKAYGTKDNLKRFIDEAHKKGMAVIMDAVLNHATASSPLAQLYWDPANNRPAANSPYFNPVATHPFNVFNDFNHDSEATKYHTARFIRHWLSEYRIDGFRWDLSKGFTQRPCGNDENCWNAYDASRVATWQRYYDSAMAVSAGAYYILEHLGNDDEEAALASRGMLLWGKMTEGYNQNTMGYQDNSNLSRSYFGNRAGWTSPHLVTYAESHDEERIMYKNNSFGNSANPSHNVKSLATGLKRTEALFPFLLLVPGPKMIWQFGELGYDHSKFECSNGTLPAPYGNEQCKLDPKPLEWDYNQDPARKRIYQVISALNKLRALKPLAFSAGNFSGDLDAGLIKQYRVTHPELSFVVIGNFTLEAQTISTVFPATGTWYNYIEGGTLTVNSSSQAISLGAGAYRIFINQAIPSGLETVVPPLPPVTGAIPNRDGLGLLVYPNPLLNNGTLRYVLPETGMVHIKLYNFSGQEIQLILSEARPAGTYSFALPASLAALAPGLYLFRIEQNGRSYSSSFFKNKP